MASVFLLWILGFFPTLHAGVPGRFTPPAVHRVTTQPLHPIIVRAHVVRRHFGRR